MQVNKKILAVALECKKKCSIAAVWANNMLIVTNESPITGLPDIWKPMLLEDLRKKRASGFVCLVEDRTRTFSPDAISFSFDTVESDGRTMLQHCFDHYFAMESTGSLQLDTSLERYRIRGGGEGSLLDIKHDEKGRIVYNINWSAVQGGHKALLMCVAAAVLEEPLSDRWMERFTANMKPNIKKSVDPLHSFYAITHDTVQPYGKAVEDAQDRVEAQKQAHIRGAL